ncbi:hypothetical protein JCM10212_001359 [Sporobolomyces blumeae]
MSNLTLPPLTRSRPGRASDLIKRFQAAVDSNHEAPLSVSSAFASPGRPRVSSGGTTAPVSSAIKPKEAGSGKALEKPADTSPQAGSDARDDQLDVRRSAGLERPPNPDREQPTKALEAFPDTSPAPTQEQADALASRSDDQPPSDEAPPSDHRTRSPVPPVAVTQPSVDVAAPVAVPGSSDLLASPPATLDAIARSDSPDRADRLDPTPSPPLHRTGSKEGLSRPSSPAADPDRLRSPPLADDNSPPPSPRADSPDEAQSGAASAVPPRGVSDSSTPQTQLISPAEPEPAPPTPEKEANTSKLTSTRSAASSESSATRPVSTPKKPSSNTSSRGSTSPEARKRISPTQSRVSATPARSPSTSKPRQASPSTPRDPAKSFTASPSTSPTNSGRNLMTPTASSLAKTRPRVNTAAGSASTSTSTSTSPSRSRSRAGGSPTSTRMSPSNSRQSNPGGAEPMKRSLSSASDASSISALHGRERAGSGPAKEGQNASSPVATRKLASRGRIGLAGAGARMGGPAAGRGDGQNVALAGRSETTASQAGSSTRQEETSDALRPATSEPQSIATPPSPPPKDEPAPEQGSQGDESIPVFKGFGAFTHGRIPIPMERTVDPETGEERLTAKQPRGQDGAADDDAEPRGSGAEPVAPDHPPTPPPKDEVQNEEEEAAREGENDDIPVFKGFGERTHGRIPIPMEAVVDPVTGEERLVAKQPRDN